MKFLSHIIVISMLMLASLAPQANAATYTGQLDLTDLSYSVPFVTQTPLGDIIVHVDAAIAIDIYEFNSGAGGIFDAVVNFNNIIPEVAFGEYSVLGFGLSDNPQTSLLGNLQAQLDLVTDPSDIDNAINNTLQGIYRIMFNLQPDTSYSLNDGFPNLDPLTLDANKTYYVFVLGGSAIPLTTDYTLEVNPVPVPAAVWLLGFGLFGLAAFKRKKTVCRNVATSFADC